MKVTKLNNRPYEGPGCGSSVNLSFFVMQPSRVDSFLEFFSQKQFSVTAYHFKNTSPCLRSLFIIRIIICGLVRDLHYRTDTVDEEFCRKFSGMEETYY
jgi:hypothetical protein